MKKILLLALIVPLSVMAQRNGSYPGGGGSSSAITNLTNDGGAAGVLSANNTHIGTNISSAQMAAIGGITNGNEIQLYTDKSAWIPGIGYTNFPNSTTAGLQEIANLYPFTSVNSPVGGFTVNLASPATSNAPATYNITNTVIITNFFTIKGNGAWATVLRYRGVSQGSPFNASNPPALLIEHHSAINGNAPPSAPSAGTDVNIQDLSFVSDVDCNATLLKLHCNWGLIKGCMFGTTNSLNTNLVTTMHYPAGNMSTSPRGLVGAYITAPGNNFVTFESCTFNDLADGIVANNADWGTIDKCQFGAISVLNGNLSQFTNTWSNTTFLHVGGAIVLNGANIGFWNVTGSPHFLDCHACIANLSDTLGSCYDPALETVDYFYLASALNTYGPIPNFNHSLWAYAVDGSFNPTTSAPDPNVIGEKFWVGCDLTADSQYEVKDLINTPLLSIPSVVWQQADQVGGWIGSSREIQYDFTGMVTCNGGGITNVFISGQKARTNAAPSNVTLGTTVPDYWIQVTNTSANSVMWIPAWKNH